LQGGKGSLLFRKKKQKMFDYSGAGPQSPDSDPDHEAKGCEACRNPTGGD
jgi:hypothetical protein